jgi:mRNA interferase MazF
MKLDKIAAILKDLVVGEIGELGDQLKREVNLRLRKVYRLS